MEDEKLAYILEAGRMAPSAVNFRLVFRHNPARGRASKNTGMLCTRMVPIRTALHSRLRRPQPVVKRSSDRKDHMDIDVAIATEHISLAAAEQGLGSCWVCNFDTDLCRKHFNLPDTIEPAVILTIGYPESPDLFEQTSKKTENVGGDHQGRNILM